MNKPTQSVSQYLISNTGLKEHKRCVTCGIPLSIDPNRDRVLWCKLVYWDKCPNTDVESKEQYLRYRKAGYVNGPSTID